MYVDYSKSVYETYRAFTLACLRHKTECSAQIIHGLLLRQHHLLEDGCASWVLDWRKKPTGKAPNPNRFVYNGTTSDGSVIFTRTGGPLAYGEHSLPVVDGKIDIKPRSSSSQTLIRYHPAPQAQ